MTDDSGAISTYSIHQPRKVCGAKLKGVERLDEAILRQGVFVASRAPLETLEEQASPHINIEQRRDCYEIVMPHVIRL